MTRPHGSRLVAAAALAAVVVAALSGCGAASDRALRLSVGALDLRAPSSTQVPVAAARPWSCVDPRASLRPIGALPSPGAMPARSVMARIMRRGRLVAGVDQNTLLLAYLDPRTGQLAGFEIDVLRQVAQAIFGSPDRIEFRAVTTAQRLQAVQQGKVDIVADAVTMNCARWKQVDFSSVYYDAHQRVLVPLGSPAGSISDLGAKQVCATKGSTSIDNIANIRGVRPRPIPHPVAQRTDCLVAIQQGTADAISTDDVILLGFSRQDSYTKIVGPPISDEPYGMAIDPRHPEFVRFVNGVLARMRADGTWRGIYTHWFGRFGPVPAPPPARYVH